MIIRTTLLTALLLVSVLSFSQQLTQSIRGRIIDVDSEIPVIAATVVVIGSDPFIGAATDIDGYFKLENVPIGRVSLEISSIGYEKRTMSNIVVNSAKEVFLNVSLVESINQLDEFTIVGNDKKDEPLNEMAIISSRQFTVEETKRYAGTL
ncbi:MAG: carboxypeptidase-like regulatory domain-containing protein, partial [Flavobacteriales bacterium]|nr:carboxypeptidase-like regulatory domain-containing protein [Flavobacteriales bacterium]